MNPGMNLISWEKISFLTVYKKRILCHWITDASEESLKKEAFLFPIIARGCPGSPYLSPRAKTKPSLAYGTQFAIISASDRWYCKCVRKRKLRVTELPFNSVDRRRKGVGKGEITWLVRIISFDRDFDNGGQVARFEPRRSISGRASKYRRPSAVPARRMVGRADSAATLAARYSITIDGSRDGREACRFGLSSATVDRDRVSSCMCRTVWRILNPAPQIPPALSLLLA